MASSRRDAGKDEKPADPQKRPYRLVYPPAGREGTTCGEMVVDLTEEQADRMRRYTRHPNARLRRVEPVTDDDKNDDKRGFPARKGGGHYGDASR